MKKILILEDNAERIKLFKSLLLNKFKVNEMDVDILFTDNVEDAKKLFDKHKKFDMIFLDHDLDNRVYVDSNEPNTGYQFAKYLNEKLEDEDYKTTVIIIHTMNPIGAQNMKDALYSWSYIPFIKMETFINDQLMIW